MSERGFAAVDAAYWWRAYQAFVGRKDDSAFVRDFAGLAREFYAAAVAAEALSTSAPVPNGGGRPTGEA